MNELTYRCRQCGFSGTKEECLDHAVDNECDLGWGTDFEQQAIEIARLQRELEAARATLAALRQEKDGAKKLLDEWTIKWEHLRREQEQAVAAERERCAKILDSKELHERLQGEFPNPTVGCVLEAAAAAIGEGREPAKWPCGSIS